MSAARSKICLLKRLPPSALPLGSMTLRSSSSPTRHKKPSTMLYRRQFCSTPVVPVLFVPHIFRGTFKPKRIGICWDGSRLAARALKDARPFLSQADTVVTISINEAQVAPAAASAQKLVQHMARTGLVTRLIELTAARSEIQPSIPSLAADDSVDMLVMGAYGHSRLQEGILGGVTREMLQTMTVPTLMSH